MPSHSLKYTQDFSRKPKKGFLFYSLFFLRLLFLSSYPLSGKQKKKSLCYHKKRKGPCGPGKLKKSQSFGERTDSFGK